MKSVKKREWIFVLCLAALFLFLGIGSIDLLDPDEGMYGSIAREMAEGGDWVTPHFNGVRYLEKPPLHFWLSALTIRWFGPSEWAVRLWSALPALGTVLLVWRLGMILYEGSGGLFSSMVMMSSVGVFRYARVAATDFLLIFSLTLSMFGLIGSCASRPDDRCGRGGCASRGVSGLYGWLFYLGLALGVLSKGFVGLVLPLLIAGLFLFIVGVFGDERISDGGHGLLTSIHSPFSGRHLVLGALLFLVLVLPWHFLAQWKNPGFLDFYIFDNQFLRFFNNRAHMEDDVPMKTLGFLLLTLVWFFPWSLLLPAARRYGFPRPSAWGDSRNSLLVGLWAVVVVVFFSLSSSRLEHYVLPAIPPLSLMVGGLWQDAISFERPRGRLKVWLGCAALGFLLLGVFLLLSADRVTPQALLNGLAKLNVYYRILKAQGAEFPFPSPSPFIEMLKGLGIVLAIGGPLAFGLLHFGMPKASFLTLLSVAGLIGALVLQLLWVIEPHHSVRALASQLHAGRASGAAIVHEGSLEYSGGLPFYTGEKILVLNGKRGDLEFGSRYDEAKDLFLDSVQFARLWESREPVFLVTRFDPSRSALKSLPGEKVFFVGQYGSRRLYTNRRLAD